jgi:hypothetical protein
MIAQAQPMQRIEDVFLQALELSGQAREDFLTVECGNASELRRQVEELLLADDKPDGFFDHSELVNLLAC